MKKGHLIVITGPTAVGKTAITVELARHFETEVISADSRQLFKEMNIGTAKPTALEMKGVPHHFVDSHSIHQAEVFNAAHFEQAALALLENLFESKSVAILSGGTGLYINALCQGFDDEIPPTDPVVRNELIALFESKGISALQSKLKALDPNFYQEVDQNNHQRLMRAIEVCLMTGKPYSKIRKGKKKERPFHIIKVGLERDREELYERINSRVDEMIHNGLVEEVRTLLPYFDKNSLKTVGYQEVQDFLLNKTTLEEAIEKIKVNTRHYAKRQLTWFKKDTSYEWFNADNKTAIVSYINEKIN